MANPSFFSGKSQFSKGKFVYLKGNCPICDGASRKCARHEPSGNIHCRGRVTNPPSNYQWVRVSEIGHDVFRPVTGTADNSSYSQQQPKQEQGRPAIEPLSIADRDRQYRLIARRRGLSTKDRAELKRRGLTDDQINNLHRRGLVFTWDGGKLDGISPNLPGAAGENRLLNFRGLAIAVTNNDGKVIGVQIRSSNGTYFWASSTNKGGAGSRLPNGEQPIAVYQPSEPKTDYLWLGEGFLKTQIATVRKQDIFIGAAGGLFTSSPEQLEQILAAYPESTLVLAADGGAVANPDVVAAYSKLNDLVVGLGRTLKVAWWGQLTKPDGDIDEIEDYSRIRLIDWEEFVAISAAHGGFERSKQRLLWKLEQIYRNAIAPKQKREPKPSKEKSSSDQADIYYSPESRLQIWQVEQKRGGKYLLEGTGTGGGKSHTVGLAEPSDFDANQIIYLTDQARNPPTETLTKENGWEELKSRNGGLIKETTVDGGIRLRRVKKGETPDIAGNCNRTGLIAALMVKNISGANSAEIVCGGCPVKEACTHSEGRNRGFLKQRREALPARKLRSHPDSMPGTDEFDYSNSVLFWDEAGENIKFIREIQVNQQDIEQMVGKVAIASPEIFILLEPLFSRLLELITEKQSKYGLSLADLLITLPPVPDNLSILAVERILQPDLGFLNTTEQYGVDLADLPPSIRRQFTDRDSETAKQAAESVQKQWLGELLRVLSGQQRGYINLKKNNLSIWYADPRHVAIAQAAKFNIFLDATLSREKLAMVLGCDFSEIRVCVQQSEQPQNIEFIQAVGLGRMGLQRGKDQQKRADAIANHYRKLDPTTKVIDFKKFGADGAWWRDSRAVNSFQETKTLVLIGTPCQNLANLAAQFSVLTGFVPSTKNKNQKLPDCFFNWLFRFSDLFGEFFDQWALREIDAAFDSFVDVAISAEFIQAIGRLRASRRPDEQLRIVIVSDFDLSETGYPIQRIDAGDICPDADFKEGRQERAIRAAVDQLRATGKKITQTAVSAITGIGQSCISKRFRELFLSLLDSFSSKKNNFDFDEAVPFVEAAIADSNTLEQVIETIQEALITWNGGAVLFNQLNHVTKTKILTALIAIALPDQQIGGVT